MLQNGPQSQSREKGEGAYDQHDGYQQDHEHQVVRRHGALGGRGGLFGHHAPGNDHHRNNGAETGQQHRQAAQQGIERRIAHGQSREGAAVVPGLGAEELKKEVVELGELCQKSLTDARRFMSLSHLMRIIVLLDQNFNKKEPVTRSPNLPLGDEIIKYINDHFQEDIQVSDITNKFNISHVTLNQQLKQSNNMSMGKYLKLVRLMHARELLLSTNKSIELVAFESGFSNARVLNRNFKEWKHKTPTEYRNEFSKYFIK